MAGASQQTAPPVHYRVSFTTELFMYGFAGLLDAGGFFLMLTGIGEIGTEIIGLIGDAAFFTWFWFLGAGFFSRNSNKKLSILLFNSIAEAIPFLNGFYPGFTIETWRMIKLLKQEDREKAEKAGKKVQAGNTQALAQRVAIAQVRQRQQIAAAQAQMEEVARVEAANDNAEQQAVQVASDTEAVDVEQSA